MSIYSTWYPPDQYAVLTSGFRSDTPTLGWAALAAIQPLVLQESQGGSPVHQLIMMYLLGLDSHMSYNADGSICTAWSRAPSFPLDPILNAYPKSKSRREWLGLESYRIEVMHWNPVVCFLPMLPLKVTTSVPCSLKCIIDKIHPLSHSPFSLCLYSSEG